MNFFDPFVKNGKLGYFVIALILGFFIIPLVTLIFIDYHNILPVKHIASDFLFR